MFQVDHVLISDDVVNQKFACDIRLCKGACCVVGDAGAPVEKHEIPVLKKAYQFLKKDLRPEAISEVESKGLIQEAKDDGYELACTNNEACVFVKYRTDGAAICAIQEAYFKKEFTWEKPISCHLFPIRIKSSGTSDFINFQFIKEICITAVENGERKQIEVSDFLEKPLTRKYGKQWYQKFKNTVEEERRFPND